VHSWPFLILGLRLSTVALWTAFFARRSSCKGGSLLFLHLLRFAQLLFLFRLLTAIFTFESRIRHRPSFLLLDLTFCLRHNSRPYSITSSVWTNSTRVSYLSLMCFARFSAAKTDLCLPPVQPKLTERCVKFL